MEKSRKISPSVGQPSRLSAENPRSSAVFSSAFTVSGASELSVSAVPAAAAVEGTAAGTVSRGTRTAEDSVSAGTVAPASSVSEITTCAGVSFIDRYGLSLLSFPPLINMAPPAARATARTPADNE